MFSMTVIIRTVGILSKAIRRIMGVDQLSFLFTKLIEHSEQKLVKYMENLTFSRSGASSFSALEL